MHECYLEMARSKGECSDLKRIARKFFNDTRGKIQFAFLYVC